MTLFNIYFKNSYKISHIPKGNSDSNVESIEFWVELISSTTSSNKLFLFIKKLISFCLKNISIKTQVENLNNEIIEKVIFLNKNRFLY